jgi:hypothetical protein
MSVEFVEIPRLREPKSVSYPKHAWELFKNPDPSYQRKVWETEEQATKNRQGFVIATGACYDALRSLAAVFDPQDVQLRPISKKRKKGAAAA